MNNAQTFAVFLEYAEPSRAVGRVGGLIDSGLHLFANDCADFIVYSWGYWEILLRPRRVRNYRELYWQEEVCSETSVLEVGRCEALVLLTHKMVHELALCRPKETGWVRF